MWLLHNPAVQKRHRHHEVAPVFTLDSTIPARYYLRDGADPSEHTLFRRDEEVDCDASQPLELHIWHAILFEGLPAVANGSWCVPYETHVQAKAEPVENKGSHKEMQIILFVLLMHPLCTLDIMILIYYESHVNCNFTKVSCVKLCFLNHVATYDRRVTSMCNDK